MRVVGARRVRAAILATLLASLVAALMPAMSVVAHDPPGMDAFMYATGQVESGGNYYAVNPYSGAKGKYQIMPANWPSWAEKYLGNRYATWAPANQDGVAHGKMHDLYHWLGAWKHVAHWWLTGRDGRAISWSSTATTYVNKVMSAYNARLGVVTSALDTREWVAETSARVIYKGSWQSASHSGYLDSKVSYATADAARASLVFTGTQITWYGPMGPTRGRAIVYIDGVARKTVDLYASTFVSRRALFTFTWLWAKSHTITIELEGTPSRPYVALDAFAITP